MILPPETRRLRFRAFESSDDIHVCKMLSDDYARQFYPQASLELGRKWVAKNQHRYREDGFGLWVIELKASGEFVGDCGITWQSVDNGQQLEVGYHIVRDFRRQGLACEAASICLQFGFQVTSADRIVSLVHKQNVASQGVAERLYCQREETVRRGMPHWVYFMTRQEFESGNGVGNPETS